MASQKAISNDPASTSSSCACVCREKLSKKGRNEQRKAGSDWFGQRAYGKIIGLDIQLSSQCTKICTDPIQKDSSQNRIYGNMAIVNEYNSSSDLSVFSIEYLGLLTERSGLLACMR